MAANTTIVSLPNRLSPSNDIQGISYIMANSSYTLNNFKYLTRLYSRDVTTSPPLGETFVVQEAQPPRPITGNGLYSPYQALLSLLSYDINLGLTAGATQAANSLQQYDIQYGLEWNPGVTISNVYSFTGFFGMNTASPHGLTALDNILIQSQNPFINGQHLVQVISATAIYINVSYSASYSVTTGIITDSQRTQSIFTDYSYAYNGTRQYGYQLTDYYNVLVMCQTASDAGLNTTTSFLTDYPQTEPKLILPYQDENLSFFLDPIYFRLNTLRVLYNFYDVSGNNIDSRTDVYNLGTYSLGGLSPTPYAIQRWDTPVGPDYLNPTASTSYYTVGVYNTSISGAPHLVQVSELRTFKIDTSCSIYNNVRLMWLNSYGAFDFFNFRLDDHKTLNVTKNEYKQILAFNYTTGARERTVISQEVIEQHVVNTDWVTEDIQNFVLGIKYSPEVYIINETTLLAYPVIVTDTDVDYKTAYRDQIFNVTLTYETSYSIETQQQ